MLAYYYYYLYFNAYWTSFDIGEKSIPRQNAIYYMTLLKIFLLSGVSFTLYSIGLEINLTKVIVIGFIAILVLNYFLLSERIFKRKLREYEFLKNVSKGKRLLLLFGVIGLAGIINITAVFLFASR